MSVNRSMTAGSLVHARGILGAIAAEVEAVAHCRELLAVGDEEVD